MEISLVELAVAVITICLIVIGLSVCGAALARSKEERRATSERVVCRLCLSVFEAQGRERNVHCPNCGGKTGRRGPTPLG